MKKLLFFLWLIAFNAGVYSFASKWNFYPSGNQNCFFLNAEDVQGEIYSNDGKDEPCINLLSTLEESEDENKWTFFYFLSRGKKDYSRVVLKAVQWQRACETKRYFKGCFHSFFQCWRL